mgnify:CR=1 FL=1
MNVNEILKHVDHTLLLQPSTWEEIKQICDDAMEYGTASVCIPPSYVKQAAEYTREQDSLGCAKLVVFCNAPDDNPFMAGAFHGVGETDMGARVETAPQVHLRAFPRHAPAVVHAVVCHQTGLYLSGGDTRPGQCGWPRV